MNEAGKNIRKFRIQMNMTQEELAQKIISSRTTVSNYETGRSSPDIDMLITISEVFDTSPDGLIFGNKKSEKKMNIKPMYYLLAVSICWIMILYQVSSGVFESGLSASQGTVTIGSVTIPAGVSSVRITTTNLMVYYYSTGWTSVEEIYGIYYM